jgi:hypothetical protein
MTITTLKRSAKRRKANPANGRYLKSRVSRYGLPYPDEVARLPNDNAGREDAHERGEHEGHAYRDCVLCVLDWHRRAYDDPRERPTVHVPEWTTKGGTLDPIKASWEAAREGELGEHLDAAWAALEAAD